MAAKATVRKIASAAGVSVANIPRVRNQPELVQPDKRDTVHQAVAALDYIPNRHARSLISQRSGAIGLLVPTLANPLFAPTVAAIEAALDTTGHALLIHCTRRASSTDPIPRDLTVIGCGGTELVSMSSRR